MQELRTRTTPIWLIQSQIVAFGGWVAVGRHCKDSRHSGSTCYVAIPHEGDWAMVPILKLRIDAAPFQCGEDSVFGKIQFSAPISFRLANDAAAVVML